jgi:hypothetical protein
VQLSVVDSINERLPRHPVKQARFRGVHVGRNDEGAVLSHAGNDLLEGSSRRAVLAAGLGTAPSDGSGDIAEIRTRVEDDKQMDSFAGVGLKAWKRCNAASRSGVDESAGGVDTPVIRDGDQLDADLLALVEQSCVVSGLILELARRTDLALIGKGIDLQRRPHPTGSWTVSDGGERRL